MLGCSTYSVIVWSVCYVKWGTYIRAQDKAQAAERMLWCHAGGGRQGPQRPGQACAWRPCAAAPAMQEGPIACGPQTGNGAEVPHTTGGMLRGTGRAAGCTGASAYHSEPALLKSDLLPLMRT